MTTTSGTRQLDVLAFGAHPDDIELTCGGTVIRLARAGYRVGAVSLTAGELGSRGDPEIRRQEFDESARIMEVSFHAILGLPDGGLGAGAEQKDRVIRVIRDLRPWIILAPYWEDRHPDHATGGRLVTEAAYLAGLGKVNTGQAEHRPVRVLYYPSRYEFHPSFVVDVSETHEDKIRAIQAYRSQFHHDAMDEFGQVQTNISHRGFLEAIVARARQYGSYVGVEFGEPFLVREPLRVDDPVAFFDSTYTRSFL